MKYLVILLLITGCATQTKVPVTNTARLDMTTFAADCRYASYQMTQLQTALSEYDQTQTKDYAYYQKLKNNIWALRSTCSAYRS